MNTPVDREQHWYEHVYQRGVKQFTLRAVLFGMVVGALMCLSNLYVFFKTGWSMGVTVTAAVILFAVFRVLRGVGVARAPFGALENNVATTVASGAGYMTGGGNMAAFGALLMITAVRPDTLVMVGWFAVIAALGVFAAIPIKRQLINHEELAFPTGTATAETIRTLHAGDGAAASASSPEAKALGISAVGAALIAVLREFPDRVKPLIDGLLPAKFRILGEAAGRWTFELKTEPVLIGGGMLMSFRTVWSMLFGAVLTYGALAPELVERGLVTEVTAKAIISWSVWPAAALLVASGLTAFALDWRSVIRTFSGLGNVLRGKRGAQATDSIESVECPPAWFPLGFALLSPIVVVLMVLLFQIEWWAALVAIPLSIVMGLVAARVTGETDITPTKAFGPVTQLAYGVMTPGNVPGNIMAANVTGGVGLHAADLLTTLKTGWLLGGNPRAQFYAQLFGVAVGAVIIVPAFDALIPDPSQLGGDDWPAPSCLVWASVSELFSGGLKALDPLARRAIVIGLVLGVALALLDKFAPKSLKQFVPSPAGLGIAMVLPASNSIGMFIGGSIAALMRRYSPLVAARLVSPIGSGMIAGESLMGLAAALIKN
ncbi:MAG: OPT family oligopeptide transporter [Planctomycetota bacterium]|nr:MAG: OPT family oligopeptide transporter [Planctomycetota bacterium]